MSKKNSKAPAEVQDDVIPSPDDDAAETTQAVAPEESVEAAESPAEEKEAPKLSSNDEARDRIARAYREKRQRESEDNEDEDLNAAGEDVDTTSESDSQNDEDDHQESDDSDADVPDSAEKDKSAPDSQDPEVALKIDGREVKKKLSEVIAIAQKNEASDDRFEEAKRLRDENKRDREETQRLLQEARALRGEATADQPDTESKDAEPDRSQDRETKAADPLLKNLDPEKLRSIAERIQIGDTDEAAEATQELAQEIASNLVATRSEGLDPEKVTEIVQQHIVKSQTQNELKGAVDAFEEAYPEIAKDTILKDAGETVLRNQIVEDMKSIGLDEDTINPIRANTPALLMAQAELRRKGHNVRTYTKLLTDVGDFMTERFNLKPKEAEGKADNSPEEPAAKPATDTSRAARKKSVSQQPRAAGVRGQIPTQPKPKTKQQIVAEIRQQRGFG